MSTYLMAPKLSSKQMISSYYPIPVPSHCPWTLNTFRKMLMLFKIYATANNSSFTVPKCKFMLVSRKKQHTDLAPSISVYGCAFCIRLFTGCCTFPLMWLYPDLTIHIFCTNHLHELTHTCTHSYLALFQNGICYHIMLFPPLHLVPLNTIFLSLPCNKVHSFLVIATCVSLLH